MLLMFGMGFINSTSTLHIYIFLNRFASCACCGLNVCSPCLLGCVIQSYSHTAIYCMKMHETKCMSINTLYDMQYTCILSSTRTCMAISKTSDSWLNPYFYRLYGHLQVTDLPPGVCELLLTEQRSQAKAR